jgi:photosystem II stability/assembly factor-like uncharacterized protein
MQRVRPVYMVCLFLFFHLSIFSLSGLSQSSDPAYLFEPWIYLGGPPGGIGYDIRMQPDNPDIMYVTDSGAGIFKSTDGGKNWNPVNEGIETIPGLGKRVFCATIDPHDYQTIWIGTQLNAQIYRSVNGGQTWERRDTGIIPIASEHSVRGITIDPVDSNIVYVALEEVINVLGGTRGEIYKSTDRGQNWQRIWYGNNLARYVWISPQNTQRLYCSTGIFDRAAANADEYGKGGGVGILRSDDGGQTWTILDENNGLGGLFCPSIFMHPENPDTLLAAITSLTGNPKKPGVFVTQDGGNTWEHILSDYSIEAVEIATGNPNVWYAARRDTIHRSDDGGETWQTFTMGTADRRSGLPIDLQVDPRDSYRIFCNSYGGGNMMSSNGGETWIDASNGYTGAGITGIVVSPLDDRKVLVGANTATFLSIDGGLTWRGTDVADRAVKIICHEVADGHGTHTLASSTWGDGNIYHSNDFGLTWTTAQVVNITAYRDNLGRPVDGLYGARAFAYAPSNPQKVYIGYAERYVIMFAWAQYQRSSPGFFRSHDGGYNWEQVENTPFEDVSILNLDISPIDEEVVYVATMAGAYRTLDGGDSWQQLDSLESVVPLYKEEGLPPVYDLAFDPFDPEIIYAGSPRGGVYRSKNGGETWEQAGFGMDPNEEIADLLPDPNRPGVIYAGSRSSDVFVSTNGADSWQRLSDGFPDVRAEQLALSGNGSILYAGTGIRGVYRLGTLPTWIEAYSPPSTPGAYNLKQNYPNPFNPATTISYSLPQRSEVVLTIYNLLGQEVKKLINEIQTPGNKLTTWDGTDNQGDMVGAGVYIYSIRTGTRIEARKMVRLP